MFLVTKNSSYRENKLALSVQMRLP